MENDENANEPEYVCDHGYSDMCDQVRQFVEGLSGQETPEELERLIDDAAFQIHQCIYTIPLECIRDEIVSAIPKELK